MFHAISHQVESIRQSLVRLVIARAICRWLAVTLSVAAVLCLFDYGMGLQDTGLRWLLTLLFAGSAITAGYCHLWPAWNYRPSQIEVARWIETAHPEWSTQLSSSLDFLQRESHGNSNPLQKRVLSETEFRLQKLDLTKSIDSTPLLRNCAALLAVASVWAAVAIGNFGMAKASASRLMMPWNGIRWPSVNQLKLVGAPSSVARGNDVLIVVRDSRATLPPEVYLELRFEDAEQPMRRAMTRRGEQMEFHIDNLQQDLRLRATGGDDDMMLWHSIAVVDAPMVSRLRVTATPPTYAKRKAFDVVSGATLLAGTALHVAGQANRAVEKAWLHVSTDQEGSNPIELDVHGKRFALPSDVSLALQSSALITIELFGADGVSSGRVERHEFTITQDAAPVAQILSPPDGQVVGPNAELAVKVAITEDIGLAAATLHIYEADGPEIAVYPIDNVTNTGESPIIVDFTVFTQDLALNSIEREFEFFATVTDLNDQSTNTNSHTLLIVPESQLLRDVAQRLARLQEQIGSTLDRETAVAEQLQPLLDSDSSTADHSSILRLEVEQRAIAANLVNAGDSIATEMESIEALIAANQLPLRTLGDKLAAWRSQLESLKTTELDNTENAFLRYAVARDLAVLRSTARHLRNVVNVLQSIYSEFASETLVQTFADSVRAIQIDQTELRTATLAYADRLLSGYSNPDRGVNLATEQRLLARRLEDCIAHFSASPASSQSREGTVLRKALFDGQLVDLMDSTSESIDQDRVVHATVQQQLILQAIEKALNAAQTRSSLDSESSDRTEIHKMLLPIRDRQVEAIVALTDLIDAFKPPFGTNRKNRIAVANIGQAQQAVTSQLQRVTRSIDDEAVKLVLSFAIKRSVRAETNINAGKLGDSTERAMAFVVDSLDTLLDISATERDSDMTQGNADQSGQRSRALDLAIQIQENINRRTELVQRQILSDGLNEQRKQELRDLAELEEQVMQIVEYIESESGHNNRGSQ